MSTTYFGMDERNNSQTHESQFIHTIARFFTGNVVDIRTNKNQVIRGVLGGYHQGVNFSLDQPAIIDTSSHRLIKRLPTPLVMNKEDIIEITATNVDSDEVVQNNISNTESSSSNSISGGLRTDAEIASETTRSRANGGDLDDGIKLEPFYPAGCEPTNLEGLELNGEEDGWNARQMFSKNESLGVESTFDPSLSAYTTELHKEDTAEFREREARASALAAEIESSSESRTMADCENDDGDDIEDEEMRFSAVQRQSQLPSHHPQFNMRGNGRPPHNDRPSQHMGTRSGGSMPMRSAGRGQSYRSTGKPPNTGQNPVVIPNPRLNRDLRDFHRHFNLQTKPSAPTGPPNQNQNASSGMVPAGGNNVPRKTEPLKSAPRNKRTYAQPPQQSQHPQQQQQTTPSGTRTFKPTDENFPPSSEPDCVAVDAKSSSTTSANPTASLSRQSSEQEKVKREEAPNLTKAKDTEEKTPASQPSPDAPKSVPTASPVAGRKTPVDSDPSPSSADPSSATTAHSNDGPSPVETVSQDTNPAANDSASKTPDSVTVASKSKLNIDAKPFVPSWMSNEQATTPNAIPIQSPPAATVNIPGIGIPQARTVTAQQHHQQVHPAMVMPQFQMPIGAPLHSQPIQASGLAHIPGGPEVGGPNSTPHGQIIFTPQHGAPPGGARYVGQHTAAHPNMASPSQVIPTYTLQHPMTAHGQVLTPSVAMSQHGQPMQTGPQGGHGRNGNGGPKRSAVVSVGSSAGGPSGNMNRGSNPNQDIQAAAMTGTPLVAPPQGAPGHSQAHVGPNSHNPQAFHAPRMDWSSYGAYGSVSTPMPPPQGRDANGQPGVGVSGPSGNTSQPPTPSSTPQQPFLTPPAVAQLAHSGSHPYVYQQLAHTAPAGHGQHAIFQHHQVGNVSHHYPHHGQHLAATPGQHVGHSGPNAMLSTHPPGALMVYHANLPGHPSAHQASVSHPSSHHPQQHHHPQQQHVPNPMVLHHMYTQPQHAQQQHAQHQQQQTPVALQVMQSQAGAPLQQFQSGPHGHSHTIAGLPYSPATAQAQYMSQSQHAGHSVPQHAPQ